MECGHPFCNDCWRQHCRVQILDGKSRNLPCMAVKCGAVCDEDKVPRESQWFCF
jgi:ariadne-1